MFPNGWPGKGLLILRLTAGGFLIQDGISALTARTNPEAVTLLLVAAVTGIFLLFGLWTPIAGILAAMAELIVALSGTGHLRSTILLAAFGVSVAMLGPGNWSIDALLFGRQRLDVH